MRSPSGLPVGDPDDVEVRRLWSGTEPLTGGRHQPKPHQVYLLSYAPADIPMPVPVPEPAIWSGGRGNRGAGNVPNDGNSPPANRFSR